MSADPRDLDRRRLLRTGAGALAAAAGVGGFVSLEFLRPWTRTSAARTLLVGEPGSIPLDGIVLLSAEHVAVGRTSGGYFALSTVCPHLGCVVRWLDDERRFHCPCHGSRFLTSGDVLNGPARDDLAPLWIGLDDHGRLVVDPGRPPEAQEV